MKETKKMSQAELWKEISIFIQATNFTEVDKGLFTKLIEEFSLK